MKHYRRRRLRHAFVCSVPHFHLDVKSAVQLRGDGGAHKRIGEAQNPGPQGEQPVATISLLDALGHCERFVGPHTRTAVALAAAREAWCTFGAFKDAQLARLTRGQAPSDLWTEHGQAADLKVRVSVSRLLACARKDRKNFATEPLRQPTPEGRTDALAPNTSNIQELQSQLDIMHGMVIDAFRAGNKPSEEQRRTIVLAVNCFAGRVAHQRYAAAQGELQETLPTQGPAKRRRCGRKTPPGTCKKTWPRLTFLPTFWGMTPSAFSRLANATW